VSNAKDALLRIDAYLLGYSDGISDAWGEGDGPQAAIRDMADRLDAAANCEEGGIAGELTPETVRGVAARLRREAARLSPGGASPDAGKPSPDHLPDAAGGATMTCCVIGCGRAAEFVIYEQGTTVEHQPADNYTHACVDHVGKMLGTIGELVPGKLISWRVEELPAPPAAARAAKGESK
jgi:hypothetical protein